MTWKQPTYFVLSVNKICWLIRFVVSSFSQTIYILGDSPCLAFVVFSSLQPTRNHLLVCMRIPVEIFWQTHLVTYDLVFAINSSILQTSFPFYFLPRIYVPTCMLYGVILCSFQLGLQMENIWKHHTDRGPISGLTRRSWSRKSQLHLILMFNIQCKLLLPCG